MPTVEADQNLLFGLLAVRTGLIDQTALVNAIQTCIATKDQSLAEVLDEQGALDPAGAALVQALASKHLGAHGGSVEMTLGSLAAADLTREVLTQLGDSTLTASLARVKSDTTIGVSDGHAPVQGAMTAAGGERFRVLRPHAGGGLGAVFVALDAELNREVALKQILDRHADDPTSRARFLIEAEITGGLEHPGIVPVYGLGILWQRPPLLRHAVHPG